MISLKKQKGQWNRFLRERKYRLSAFGLTPHFDWKFTLLSAVFILIIISISGILIYTSIVGISESDIETDPVSQKYVNPVEVNEFISEFESKEKRFNALFGSSAVAE